MSAGHKDTKQIKKEDQKAYHFPPAALRMLFLTVLRSKVNYSVCMANSGDFWKHGSALTGRLVVRSQAVVLLICG